MWDIHNLFPNIINIHQLKSQWRKWRMNVYDAWKKKIKYKSWISYCLQNENWKMRYGQMMLCITIIGMFLFVHYILSNNISNTNVHKNN